MCKKITPDYPNLHIWEDYSLEVITEYIHSVWNEYTTHGWCHTISNAMIVAASLLYGGATVGSILGMAGGYDFVGKEWKEHLSDTLETTIFGYERVKISECAKKTLEHTVIPE